MLLGVSRARSGNRHHQLLGWTAVVLVVRSARRLPDAPVGRGTASGSAAPCSSSEGSFGSRSVSLTNTVDPFPTVAEPIFFVGYASLIVGTVLFARLRSHQGGNTRASSMPSS